MRVTFFEKWRERLQQAGLDGLAGAVLEVLTPLSLLGAQLLWVAQPTLSLFVDWARITAWAEFLEDPQGKMENADE